MKVLFQGDSITDAGRDRSDPHRLGGGYPKYAAKYIREAMPDTEFEFINLGISGDQTANLVARLQKDFIDIGADVVSILIGINDTWHRAGTREYLDDAIFEQNYRTVLDAVKKTGARILMLEPFLLPAEDKMYFYEDLYKKILIVRKLAREYADEYIALDGLFAEACLHKDYTFFSADGVHPTPDGGSDFIGKLYAEAFVRMIGK
ncbi:MAG: GDSL family lipase [Clostridia bacterium]|nr:GDSL family lipase [Clostridia bacterium]